MLSCAWTNNGPDYRHAGDELVTPVRCSVCGMLGYVRRQISNFMKGSRSCAVYVWQDDVECPGESYTRAG